MIKVKIIKKIIKYIFMILMMVICLFVTNMILPASEENANNNQKNIVHIEIIDNDILRR